MAGKLAPISLLGLALSVFYFIFYFSFENGLFPMMTEIVKAGRFPDGTPLRSVYTGLPQTDKLLTQLVAFFWPISSFEHPALFLHSAAFSGTFAAGWILVTLETWRKGNAWTLSGLYVALYTQFLNHDIPNKC